MLGPTLETERLILRPPEAEDFDACGWTEVIHCIDPENARSAAVARRLGSRLLRTERLPRPADTFDCQIWGQSREAWREGRG